MKILAGHGILLGTSTKLFSFISHCTRAVICVFLKVPKCHLPFSDELVFKICFKKLCSVTLGVRMVYCFVLAIIKFFAFVKINLEIPVLFEDSFYRMG